MYFLMIPLTLRGGSQETNTTELDAAAALTPAGGPGTVRVKRCTIISYNFMILLFSCATLHFYEAVKSSS